ncbi:hypothetical protein ABIB25_004969 [Nakamurella sp. UYEF19]|uniref:hypothetical protein n=1 Tax=Nakamurella sp. UYEF19 TaxID=1756392 RepID=UPI00339896D3
MLTEELPQGGASLLRDRIGHDLPGTLTVSLWDFTGYTRTGPGEPFADLHLAQAHSDLDVLVVRPSLCGVRSARCAGEILTIGPNRPVDHQ